MRTTRTCTLIAATLVFVSACGGSGNGDVTIATDDPPAGSSATGRTGALSGDAAAQAAAIGTAAPGDRAADASGTGLEARSAASASR